MPIPPIRPDDQRAPTGGIVRAARRPPGWSAPGPRPALADASPDRGPSVESRLWPSAEEDLCWLAGDFRILQRLDGHRWSLDDLVTAWVAARAVERPQRICDLGCGIGTVLLFLAWCHPEARLIGVEAQSESASLARRSLDWNEVAGRVEVRSGDLRAPASFGGEADFDLVSGTPPYFPSGTGVESSRPQCAPCRFEHRGGVEDYIQAMARLLSPVARGVLCQGASQTHRVPPAVEDAGLAIEAQLDVVPRAGKAVLISIYTVARRDVAKSPRHETLVVRERDGQWTPAFRQLRLDMGMPPGRHDAH